MATQQAADTEPNLTECAVCHDLFTVPKLLPCSHVLCRGCLVTWLQSQPQAGCPLCRCAIVDPIQHKGRNVEEVADGFPTDLALTAMVEAETLLSKQHVCCVCVDVAAVALCLQCGDMYCQQCSNVHKKMTMTKHHELEQLSSLTTEKLAAHHPAICPDHEDKVSEVYCTSHDASLCVLCTITTHNNCSGKITMSKKIGELTTELLVLDGKMSEAVTHSDNLIQRLDKHVQELERDSESALMELRNVFDRLKAALETRFQSVKEETLNFVREVTKNVNDYRKYIIQIRSKTETQQKMSELYGKFTGHKHFKDMVKMVKDRSIEVIKVEDLPDNLQLNHKLIMSIDPQTVADIERNLSRLGDRMFTPVQSQAPSAKTTAQDKDTVGSNVCQEFLNSWFPDLDSKSYVIPVTHVDHIHADITDIGDVPTGVLRPKDDCAIPAAQVIKERDDTHKTVHFLFTKLKDHTAKEEVMVMMTQASIVSATTYASLEDIIKQKHKHSDLVIVNKQRGVLVCLVQSVHVADPNLARQKLEESVTYLTEAARIVQEGVRTVHGADNVAVRTTLVLSNITRAQLEEKHFQLQKAVQGVPCLCKDEMVTDQCLERWWKDCWSSRHLDFIDRDLYRDLVARFAIPATRVEIYLTTQPRLQLKHEHDVVNAVGDVHGAEVFQAGLHQLSLFPTQAGLLDFDCLDDSVDDVKLLWGPPGTGKTILLVLRALQWVKHFSARHIVILQTRDDGTAASCLVEYQLQQTLNAQQQRARQSGTDTQSAQCTFTHVDMSELCRREWNPATGRYKVVLQEGWKEKLYTALGLQQRGQSDTAIHIVADEADGDVVAAVYQWLKEHVTPVRLWAAGVEAFRDKENIPASLQHAVCHVTEPLRCPGPVVQEVMRAGQIKQGDVPRYDVGWQLTDGPPVVQLQHYWDRDGHTGPYPWRCGLCIKNIAARLRSLHVGEDEGLSANDVFILGSYMFCDLPDDDSDWSPAPLINGLRDNGYNVRTLSRTSARDEVMAVVQRDVTPPAVTVANEDCVWGLERKIVVYCGSGDVAPDWTGRLRAFSRTTSLLIYIETLWS